MLSTSKCFCRCCQYLRNNKPKGCIPTYVAQRLGSKKVIALLYVKENAVGATRPKSVRTANAPHLTYVSGSPICHMRPRVSRQDAIKAKASWQPSMVGKYIAKQSTHGKSKPCMARYQSPLRWQVLQGGPNCSKNIRRFSCHGAARQ